MSRPLGPTALLLTATLVTALTAGFALAGCQSPADFAAEQWLAATRQASHTLVIAQADGAVITAGSGRSESGVSRFGAALVLDRTTAPSQEDLAAIQRLKTSDRGLLVDESELDSPVATTWLAARFVRDAALLAPMRVDTLQAEIGRLWNDGRRGTWESIVSALRLEEASAALTIPIQRAAMPLKDCAIERYRDATALTERLVWAVGAVTLSNACLARYSDAVATAQARLASDDGRTGLEASVELYVAGRLLALAGIRPNLPGMCRALFSDTPRIGFRSARPIQTYVVCHDLAAASGTVLSLGEAVRLDMDLRYEVSGRMANELRVDATGLAYTLGLAEIWGWPSGEMQLLREAPTRESSGSYDDALLAVEKDDRSRSVEEWAQALASGEEPGEVPLAMMVLRWGVCPLQFPRPAGVTDSGSALRRAFIERAERSCGLTVSAPSGESLEKEAHAIAGRSPVDILALWKVLEARCLDTDQVVALAPDEQRSVLGSTQIVDQTLTELYTRSRIAQMQVSGCRGGLAHHP